MEKDRLAVAQITLAAPRQTLQGLPASQPSQCWQLARSVVAETLSFRCLSFLLMVYIICELARPSPEETWSGSTWRSLKGIPILGCGFDFAEDVSEWIHGCYVVGWKHAFVPQNLEALYHMAPSKGAMLKAVGTGKDLAWAFKAAVR